MSEIGMVRIIDEVRGLITGVRLLCIPETIVWIAMYPLPEDSDSPVDYYEAPDSAIEVVQSRVISEREARQFLWDNLFHKITGFIFRKQALSF